MNKRNIYVRYVLVIQNLIVILTIFNIVVYIYSSKNVNNRILSLSFILTNLLVFALLFCYRILLKEDYLYMTKINDIKDFVLDVNKKILGNNSIQILLDIFTEKAVDIIEGAESGNFMILKDNGFLKCGTVKGHNSEKVNKIMIRLEDVYHWDPKDKKIEYKNKSEKKGILCCPVIVEGRLYGILNVESSRKNVFDKMDVQLLSYLSKEMGCIVEKFNKINKISDLSKYDSLTKLYNRNHLEKVLDTLTIKEVPFCLVFFDLDELKQINDRYGHAAGDMAIKKFAETIKGNIRNIDLLGRYGGDEFIGIFMNSDRKELNNRLLNIIKKFNSEPIIINNHKIIVNFSYGIASFPEDSSDINTLISIADKSMYKFKNWKKNYSLNF